MRRVYHPPPFGQRRVLPLLIGAALAGCLFLLLPLTQFLARPSEEPVALREVDTAQPIPPPPPPPPPGPPEPATEAPPRPMAAPEMERSTPPLSLPQLQLALEPGLGELEGDFTFNFNLAPGEVAEVDAYRVEEVDEQPQPIRQAEPHYPRELQRAGISGHVTLEFIIEADGTVSEITVTDSTHHRFERSAVEAARRWHFTPATRDGQPVRMIARQTIPFNASL